MTRPDPLASDNDADDAQPSDWLEPGAEGSSPAEGEDPAPTIPTQPLTAPSAPATPTAQAPPPPPPPPPPPEPVAVPIYWIVDHAAPPIRYRALVELARIAPQPPRLAALVYGYQPAVRLALGQRPEGTWSNAMLAVPESRASDFEGVGTILAFRRLLEYGWDRDAPPLFHARRLLFRLLAEDNDATLLYELGDRSKPDEDFVRRHRALLREAAAAALAQAGYESDPRLRGAALRLLQRVAAFLRSPRAADPWEVVNGKRVLAPGATPPTYFFLLMLAHMPLFRLEHASELDEILKYLTARAGDAGSTSNQSIAQRLTVLGDPLADQETQSDVALTIAWLELAARLGYLKRHEGWMRAFDRLLEQCDDGFVWRARRSVTMTRTASAFVWPTFPLVPNASADEQAAELTFRLGLIGRFAGRPLEFV